MRERQEKSLQHVCPPNSKSLPPDPENRWRPQRQHAHVYAHLAPFSRRRCCSYVQATNKVTTPFAHHAKIQTSVH